MKKDLAELKRRQLEQAGELRAMLDKAESENRNLTAAEDVQYKAIESQIDTRKAQIEREERLQSVESALATPGRTQTRSDVGDGVQPARTIVQEEVRCMVQQKDGSHKEGRAIDPIKEFRTFGEQMSAIVRAGRGEGLDPRLTSLRAASGLNETAPSDGGFLVQHDFSTAIFSRTYELGQVLSRCRRVPIGAGANGLKTLAVDETSRATGSRWGGVQVYRVNEADAGTAKKPKFRRMELNLKKLIGVAYATDELLQDSTALESILMQAFPEEFSFAIEREIFEGQGAGEMLGVLNSPALVSVAKETSQVAATIVAENVLKMWSRCWSRSRANSVWFINQDCEPTLYQMNFKIKNVAGTENVGGMPVYIGPGGLSGSPYATLYGRPVIPVEYCATVGTKGDIMLMDMSQYLVIDKGGLQSAQSMHVRFLNDEQTFRWTIRNDGQPIWNAPLTPFKGSNTLSPFVSLDVRS
jgi:HK97 family phage major capsid protein